MDAQERLVERRGRGLTGLQPDTELAAVSLCILVVVGRALEGMGAGWKCLDRWKVLPMDNVVNVAVTRESDEALKSELQPRRQTAAAAATPSEPYHRYESRPERPTFNT